MSVDWHGGGHVDYSYMRIQRVKTRDARNLIEAGQPSSDQGLSEPQPSRPGSGLLSQAGCK